MSSATSDVRVEEILTNMDVGETGQVMGHSWFYRLNRAGLRGRQSRQPPRAPGFRGPPNAKNRAPACSYQKIEIP